MDFLKVYNNNNYCIASYLENCKTNKQSPGLGDFMRGCLLLIKLCKENNYNFYINKDSHEMFSFFEDNNYFIDNNSYKIIENPNVIELIPPLGYDLIDYNLKKLFNSKQNLNILTSGFYNYPKNFGKIDDYQFNIINKLFTPNKILQNEINIILNNLEVEKNKYNVLHIRTGDKLIRNDKLVKYILDDVIKIIDNNNLLTEKTIIVSDSSKLALELEKVYCLLKYYDTKKYI